jgi:hypothetical protein
VYFQHFFKKTKTKNVLHFLVKERNKNSIVGKVDFKEKVLEHTQYKTLAKGGEARSN